MQPKIHIIPYFNRYYIFESCVEFLSGPIIGYVKPLPINSIKFPDSLNYSLIYFNPP